MPYRNKTYIVFDGDEDMASYRMMCAWAANQKSDFTFQNAHDLNTARDDSLTDSIKAQLRIRLDNTKLMVVLIGKKTKSLRKFVPWEIEQAISRDIPIVAVNLNGSRKQDDLCPASLQNALAMYVPYKQKIIEYAMDNWPGSHAIHKAAGKSGWYFYVDSVYTSLGL